MKRAAFMQRAIDLSPERMEAGCGGPFGAVIVKGRKIVAEGNNEITSSNDPTAHAEITAIRAACVALGKFSLDGCEIYTSCEPCPMCLGAVYWAWIDRIYYGNTPGDAARIGFDDEFLYAEILQPPEHRKIPMCLLEAEAGEAFRAWERKPDKIRY